ncbi:MAG: membrane protein insertase YidC [Hyphomicrobiales bacterium]|nr:membrane protein insertase YidC [Hyphomicrobiales bacterium]
MDDNKNFILAIVLSIVVLVVWQVMFAVPEAQRLRQEQQRQAAQQQTAPVQPTGDAPGAPAAPGGAPSAPGVQPAPGAPVPPAAVSQPRDVALQASPRLPIDTPALKGSIALRGARIDDIVLKNYRVTVNPASDNVILFSPSRSPEPFYAEWGWVQAGGEPVKLPTAETVWTAQFAGPLTPAAPLTLTYDNGEGLIFSNTIAVDDRFLFTFTQSVENKSGKVVTLSPYALISRHGVPKTEGFFIQHEGLIGVPGDGSLQEIDYTDLTGHEDFRNPAVRERRQAFSGVEGGWLGITDKYWAAALIPDQKTPSNFRFGARDQAGRAHFQTDYVAPPVSVQPNASHSVTGRLFAGAKQVTVIDQYKAEHGVNKFEYLIDWGWFYFITKPLFYVLDYFYKLFGNFGVSILVVTVLIKALFFPLANKSYAAMSKLKKLQPDMLRIRERYKDDKMRQQQEMMALYKKEKVNPLSGCLPVLIQIPVFFALYKVLFITIEMRHAPFFGWIQDLSAPDPTSIFNLFGLLPFEVPALLLVGVWPILMGVTMLVQMKLNPTPTDPIQQQIFTWMPVLFTFMLASFPAGLVIYWTWNNLLSIIQQWVIMERHGVKVELWDNMGMGGGKLASTPTPTSAPTPSSNAPKSGGQRGGKPRNQRRG